MINRSERCREEVFVLCIQENLSNIEIPFFFSISGGLQIFSPGLDVFFPFSCFLLHQIWSSEFI